MYHLPDQQIRQQIDKMFLRYDKDRSNTLDPSQLAPFLNQIFEKTKYPSHVSNLQEARQLLKYIDINHDGNVSKPQIFNVFKYLINSSAEINGVNINQQGKYNGQNNGNYGYQNYGNNGQQLYGNNSGGSNPYGNNNFGNPNDYGYKPNQYGDQNPYGKQYGNQNNYKSSNSQQDIEPPYFSHSSELQSSQNNRNPDILGILAKSLQSNNQQGSQVNTYGDINSQWSNSSHQSQYQNKYQDRNSKY